jgi:hypothetical protein
MKEESQWTTLKKQEPELIKISTDLAKDFGDEINGVKRLKVIRIKTKDIEIKRGQFDKRRI